MQFIQIQFIVFRLRVVFFMHIVYIYCKWPTNNSLFQIEYSHLNTSTHPHTYNISYKDEDLQIGSKPIKVMKWKR